MKRFLVCVMMVFLVVSAYGQGNREQARKAERTRAITMNIGHGASEAFHLHRALVRMKETLEATGRYDVRLYPSSQFGNDREMIGSVTTGDLTMALNPSSFFTQHSNRMTLIELPYVFPSREAAIKTLASAWGKAALRELDDDGLVGIGFMENGLRHLTNSKGPVVLPDDLRGFRLRTMQVPAHVEFWNLTKASASGSPFPELYTNLATGVFDGQENPIAHIYSQKFYEVQDYLTLTGHVYTTYVAIANKDWWDKLPDSARTEIREAFEAAYAYQLTLISNEESKQLSEMVSKGLKVRTLTPAEKEVWMKTAAPLVEKYAKALGGNLHAEFAKTIAAASK